MMINQLANWENLRVMSMSLYKKYGIYGIRNKQDGKIYIGKTMKSFGDRWDCHKAQLRGGYHDNKNLQSAWNSLGENCFEFIIIKDCTSLDIEKVNQSEINEIKKYKALNLAYNIHDGGDIPLYFGKHLPEETKRKIGEKNRINMLGRKASDETRRKMSESQSKRYSSWTDQERKEWGDLMSKHLTGIKKPKTSEAMKGNKNGAKYSVEQVLEIRRLHENEQKNYTEISQIMNIPRGVVYNIATYRRWKDIPTQNL